VIGFLFLISFNPQPIISQTQQTALSAIQQAENKLVEALNLLEEISDSKVDIRDLVIITDSARYQISLARENYNGANYSVAYDMAIVANEELEEVIDELEVRRSKNQQNTTLLFSLLGVFLAILLGLFVFLIVKYGYPWYLEKRDEEYGKLEIHYIKEMEGENNG
jgi:hypothetical protein